MFSQVINEVAVTKRQITFELSLPMGRFVMMECSTAPVALVTIFSSSFGPAGTTPRILKYTWKELTGPVRPDAACLNSL